MNLKVLLFNLFFSISVSCGSKILMVFPLPSRSHFFLGYSLATGLVKAGHDVSFISKNTDKPPQGNGTFRYINIPDCMPVSEKDTAKFNYFNFEKMSPFLNLPFMNFFGNTCTKAAFESENVKKLLQSDEKFDVVIIETLFTEGLAAFACHFNAPLIVLSPIGPMQWVNDFVGNPTPVSYSPNVLLDFSDDMTFWQKSQNYLMSILISLNQKFLNLPKHNELIRKHFPKCPNVEEISKNIAVILSNSHESINPAVPSVPNIVNIGGFHISKSTKKLPADFQKLLDNAKNGVIYFSLGSHVKQSDMTPEMKSVLVKVLGSVKQLVFWKWDDSDFPTDKPDNIIFKKWFPQQDILAHPNIKLFITHGGILSLSETVNIGVPILAMPVLGDQKYNANRAEALGIGKYLMFSQLTEENFSNILNELLTNPKYAETVKQKSAIFRDRPMHPLDLAVYWIEYVIKHKGAPHLRVIGRELSWFQYYCIDIILVWGIIILSPIFIILKIFKKLCCSSRKEDKIKTS